MKQVTAYEDNRGNLHKIGIDAELANARYIMEDAIDAINEKQHIKEDVPSLSPVLLLLDFDLLADLTDLEKFLGGLKDLITLRKAMGEK